MIASRDGLAQQEVSQEVDAEILAFHASKAMEQSSSTDEGALHGPLGYATLSYCLP
jgi:predicted regulator of Ras-like GTPase activity (Roadblock/LC7/MglB family)